MKLPLLQVANLNVEFSIHKKKLYAVRGISFEIDSGEAVGIVGESGSGKSAAVQSILSLDPASKASGSVYFDGENLFKKTPDELRLFRGKEIGMVFQDPMTSLNPTMKIGDQITEGLIHHKLFSRKNAKEKALELLKKVGIPEPELRFSQYPHMLSGGMRQRVLIAISLAMSPRLLIADEPTTALDGTVSTQILTLLKQLTATSQTALLLITHDISLVASYCDRVLVMYAGKIVEQGKVEEVFRNPKHPYTQMLFHSLPRLDRPKDEKLIPIDGNPPNLFSKPKGCPFAPRCPFAYERCLHEEPPLEKDVSCWRFYEPVEKPQCRSKSPLLPLDSEISKSSNLTSAASIATSLIEVTGLTKIFRIGHKKLTAVNNVSFSIKQGEILGLIGESGCGKSTLAKLLVRLETPTQGQIFFEGKEISRSKDRSLSRNIQMIFQDPFASLNPRMTVEDLIREPLFVHGLPINNRVDELLDMVGLSNHAKHRFPHEFSGGQRQRIGIARALALKPKFLICDEPISALDVSIQAQIVQLLKELQKELKLTYLFISHDLPMIRHIADRIAVMYLGSFVELAPSDLLLKHPQHPYTQLLIGSVHTIDPELEKKRERIQIFKDPPSPLRPPRGCPFSEKCPKAAQFCHEKAPTLQCISETQKVACHLHPINS